ncbi:SagB/ThcOx family dehydrogenase [Herbidospora galbida]|uniref:SagB/ThcOx family dehydrogenase n=1 Tax=Herbidospora galbida TaxID=2575442 RepID=A0A4U3MJG2_9ACTN|nr:SagB family peptide dehydrogenase [Herbidospora galbida]TKK89535.1 SagB/ThcOx family dehydrogenase [Herbidospora galbida]
MIGLRPDAVVTWQYGVLTISHTFGTQAARGLTPRIAALLGELPGALVHEDDLAERLLTAGGTSEEVALLYLVLDRLHQVLVRTVEPVLRVTPIARDATFRLPRLAPDDTVRLSRFALVRRSDDGLILESPLSRHRVTLTEEAMPLIAALARGVMVKEAPEALAHLVATGMAGDDLVEDDHPALRAWEFHDLLFHNRSRVGRHDQPVGATFRFRDETPPEPALKPLPEGPITELFRPSLDEPGPAFTTVLEGRRSVRSYASVLTARQLGELLYRTARVRAVFGPTEGAPYETSSRPYPGGGACHELELYLTVRECEGLAGGVYYYDPLGHRLVGLAARDEDQRAMLAVASMSTGYMAQPDVLITITSRFQRMSWKYAGLAYAASLKNVGVLYQTFYLVATAMGLSPCGLGAGDAELAARTFGLDWATESSVGEFLIGGTPGL